MVNETAWVGAAKAVKYGVHLGMWTNWSRGRVLGATLTLSRKDGNYLLAFTAFFIGLVSTRFWRILCFILHNRFSTSTPRDALYHQQQAILRNSDSAESGLLVLCQLVWAWRKTVKRSFLRVLPVIATAAFSATAFTMAGGFSSSISTGVGNDVLLDGSNCAFVNTGYPDIGASSVLQPYTSRRSNSAANYAQQCYSTNASGIFDCGTFVKARIPSSVDKQTPSPFAEGLCQSDANIRLDTGYIDSHVHLGLNAPFDERILFRTVLQCAPLVTEGYTKDISNISTPAQNYTAYYYGPDRLGKNYTFSTSSWDSQYLQISGNEFKLTNLLTEMLNGSVSPLYSDFTPTPGLFPADGDLMLTFLIGNGVQFLERTDDPWYRGTVPGENFTWIMAKGQSKPSYRPEQAASPLGCLQQYQFCNPALPEESRCGPLASLLDAQTSAAHLFNMTEDQIADNDIPDTAVGSRYVWFLQFLTLATIGLDDLINALGPNSLASQPSLNRYGGIMGVIPDDQWQLDVENWWAIYMASMQAGMVDVANGPNDPALEPYEIVPFNSHIKNLCNNQKILSSDYTSFSAFGLCFIYVIGALIIATSLLLEPIQAWLYRRRNLKEYAYFEWTANETLQLQRMAYQGLASGHWSCYTDRIPLAEPSDTLANLAGSYPFDVKEEADAERGLTVNKGTGTTVTTVQAAPLTPTETNGSSGTPCDNDSHVEQAGAGRRQSVEVVPAGHSPRDEGGHSPALPNVDANHQAPGDAAPGEVDQTTPQISKDYVTGTPVM